MELSDLKKSISGLSEDELHNLLSSIRANRRVSKRPPAAVKKETTTAEISTKTLLNNISPEQAAMLLKLMEAQ